MRGITDQIKRKYGPYFAKITKIKGMKGPLSYAKYYKSCPIKENTVFYQAYRNKIMAGNPFAIFKELMEDPAYSGFTHVWAYDSDSSLEDDTFQRYKDCPNVIYVKSNSREYFRALAECQYLINNAALPSYWSKKEDQIYLNTWHGTPLKTLGRQAKDRSFASISNAQRNLFLADYLVMPNRYTIERMREAYDFQNILPGKILDAGYPRVDSVLKADQDHIRQVLEGKLGYSLEGKKIVLYAPTFRSSEGKSVDTTAELGHYMTQLMDMLPDDYELVFKVHNMMAAFFKGNDQMKNRLIFDEIETNELLSVTDVLITDYSSIFFEYLCTKKPILFFVYDRKEYEGDRGLYRPLEEMPGAICETTEELRKTIQDLSHGIFPYEEKLNHYLQEFAYNDDGHAARRVVDICFGKSTELDSYIHQEEKKRNVLILSNNILSGDDKFNNLSVLRQYDCDQDSVMILAKNIFNFTEDIEAIDPRIKLNCSNLNYLSTLFEKVCFKLFKKVPGETEFYDRQYHKFFGNMVFDEVVETSPSQNLWKKVITPKTDSYTRQYPKTIQDLKELRESNGHKMTALFVGAFDSTNYVFVNLIQEFNRRGYESIVVVIDPKDAINNKMFMENNIPMIGIDDFNYGLLSDVDFVLATPFNQGKTNRLRLAIERRRIFSISFANLFSSIVMRIYTDLIFTVGDSKFQEYEDNGLHYSMVTAGNPQYDDLIIHRQENKKQVDMDQIKKILFIDQGGYPFGTEGKGKLGEILMTMARKNPDKTFVVKPRFLPVENAEAGNVLHRPSEHLYDFIQNPPANLILQRTPTILEDIMNEFDAMITMWSTAYLDAALMGIPLLLIHGLPTEDVFDVRIQRIEEAYDRLIHTGCVMEYQELLDGKLEFHYVDEDYLREEVGDIHAPSAPKIVSAMEQIYDQLIVPGKRLKSHIQMDMETFQQELPGLDKINMWSNEYGKRRAFQQYFNDKMQTLAFDNRCMAKPFDMSPLQKYWYFQPKESMTLLGEKLHNTKMYFDVRGVRKRYFTGDNMKRETDPIRLDYYLEWLFQNSKDSKILNFKNPNTRPESLSFYHSMVHVRKKEYKKAAVEFARYYHEIKDLQVKPLQKDRNTEFRRFPKGLKFTPVFEELLKLKEYELLEEAGASTYFNIYLRIYFQMCALEAEGKKEELIEVYHAFQLRANPLPVPESNANEMEKQRYFYYSECIKMAERNF